ncbi:MULTISPECIES: Cof-type HAD-IIB family hydrolase [Shouchella]|uniref:Cof-type HAD-IIB family hydrolase n=2 Tax=Shouchella TaxID=2893057 RepID=A0ABY7W5P3_9BACI|nr:MULTISPECIES: Cof-type HAD-IIB family hydrolase [Shouchella]MED4127469.1 Cof-type HAD-IIB family hydrolase [Shouchella miscanthi]WDF03936.1 Cof-type HAD-IIB family hydrolase [Shouchella hunanensis]GAF22689.1 hydrolase [Bacillus sp. JCM 19047]
MEKATIFFDIDGTLLDDNKELPVSTKESIKQLQADGHHVAIATGRAPYFFKELREELQIDSYICFNGQYVVYKGEIIYQDTLNPTTFSRFERYATSVNHPLIFMSAETYTANHAEHPHILESIHSLKLDLPSYNPNYYEQTNLHQALLFCKPTEEEQYRERFPEFKFVRWHPLSVDVLPANGSKALGISKFIAHAGIDLKHVYAFGDQLNDLEMLSYVEHGVAMGNAPQEVQAQARYITKHVNEGGIKHGLSLVGLL